MLSAKAVKANLWGSSTGKKCPVSSPSCSKNSHTEVDTRRTKTWRRLESKVKPRIDLRVYAYFWEISDAFERYSDHGMKQLAPPLQGWAVKIQALQVSNGFLLVEVQRGQLRAYSEACEALYQSSRRSHGVQTAEQGAVCAFSCVDDDALSAGVLS
eukprot:19521-Heterococcus_DN1.PRE.1